MLSQGHIMYAPLYYSTVQVGPRFGDLHSLQYHGWGWYPTQTQTTSTSILDILSYNMFEPLACYLKAIWVHPYAVTPNKLALDLGILGHLLLGNDVTMSWLRLMSTSDCFPPAYLMYTKCLSHWYAVSRPYGWTPYAVTAAKLPQIWEFRFTCGVKMMTQSHGWGWYPPETTSNIHIWYIQSVWATSMLSQGHTGAPLYRHTGQVGPRFGNSDSLVEWKCCHSVMF